jgi:hypothetical protein
MFIQRGKELPFSRGGFDVRGLEKRAEGVC